MSGRKITLALISLIFLSILYLNYSGNSFESNASFSNDNHQISDKNDKSIRQMPLQKNTQVISSAVIKNEDIGILECLPDISFDEEARNTSIDQYLQSLDESAPLYYSLFAIPPKDESRLDLLFDYYNQHSTNPIISMDLVSLCINSSDERCTNHFINDAIISDPNNGAILLGSVLFYAAKGDDDKVLSSIEALEKTSLFNERYGEKALLYAQALEGSASNEFNLNAMTGIAKSATSMPSFGPIIQWCEQQLGESEKANACLSLGIQLETRSKTLRNKMVGIALQEMVFKSESNIDAIQLINKRREELNSSFENERFEITSIMMILDERLLRSWLNNVDFYGETESQRMLVEEAEALYKENENYLCTLVYEMIDSLL